MPMSKKLLLMIMFINIGFVFNGIFKTFKIEYLIYITSLIVITSEAMKFIIKGYKIRLNSVFLLFITSIIPFIITTFKYGISISLVAYLSTSLFFILWLLIAKNYKGEQFYNILRLFFDYNIIFGVVTALLGIYQFFLDSSLLGFATHEIYGNNELMESGIYLKRVTGLMGSPQNYSLYLGLVTTLIILNDSGSRKKVIPLIIVLAGGLLSGSRSYAIFIITLIIYYILKYKKTRRINTKKIGLILFLLLIFTIFVLFKSEQNNVLSDYKLTGNTIHRMFRFISDWPALLVFRKFLKSLSIEEILFGKGIGYNERIIYQLLKNNYVSVFGEIYTSYESYLISRLVQKGVFSLIAFIVFYVRIVLNSIKQLEPLYTYILFLILINISFTPSFTGMTMSFIIWPFLLLPLYGSNFNVNKNSLNEEKEVQYD